MPPLCSAFIKEKNVHKLALALTQKLKNERKKLRKARTETVTLSSYMRRYTWETQPIGCNHEIINCCPYEGVCFMWKTRCKWFGRIRMTLIH